MGVKCEAMEIKHGIIVSSNTFMSSGTHVYEHSNIVDYTYMILHDNDNHDIPMIYL